MKLKPIETENFTALNAFQHADTLRDKALECLETAENFYIQVLNQYPEKCELELAHERGKIEAMVWQTRQLRSMSPIYFSQAGQDCFLDKQVFRGKKDGFFLEIGGYDGVSYSNCLFFESIRGWEGLFIEPSPQQIERAQEYRRCECLQTAIGAENTVTDFVNITSGYTQMSGLKSLYQSDMMDVVRSSPKHYEETLKISVQRLEDILIERNISKVDYCSLDVEGAEFSILSDFPFNKFDISVWSIDNMKGTSEIGELMTQNGYYLLTVLGHDEIYHKKQ